MDTTEKEGFGSIDYYNGGVQITAGSRIGAAGPGGKRGKIKEWSKSSRRRLREFMLKNQPPDDYWTMGATFTIPGPVPTVPEFKALWKDWTRKAEKDQWCAVWRMEVQKRGAVHWHLLIAVPKWSSTLMGDKINDGAPDAETLDRELLARDIQKSWMAALTRMGPVKLPEGGMPMPGKSVGLHNGQRAGIWIEGEHPDRAHWWGADRYAVDVQCEGGNRGKWRRYMQDHASKAKQEQIPEGFGRHWGVIGRKRFVGVFPAAVDQLSKTGYYAFLRAFQRLCTPSFPAPCVFGRRLGSRIRRGKWGKSVWYTNPETVKRLASWAATIEDREGGTRSHPLAAKFMDGFRISKD